MFVMIYTMYITINIIKEIIMNNTLDSIKIALAMIAIFVFLGFVFAGFWHLFELATGYTEGLFRMAGY